MSKDKNPEENMCVTLLCQGTLADGQAYWAYVEMAPSKAIAFREAMHGDNAPQPQAYGEVIEWGYGSDVPSEKKAEMEKERGVSHNLEEQLKRYTP